MGNGLTNVENEILFRLQHHVTMRNKISLAELAEECHVAQSTVVKMSKKLGYSGYVEMYYHLMESEQNAKGAFVRKGIIEGDLETVIHSLACKLKECEDRKNIINTYGMEDILGTYLSRKLSMFDILAPATYDYIMARNPKKEKGIAFFCNQRSNLGEYAKEMAELTRSEGYYIVAFSDEKDNWIKGYTDMYIQIHRTEYKTADFYMAKMLIIFELLLSEYARISHAQMEGTDERD